MASQNGGKGKLRGDRYVFGKKKAKGVGNEEWLMSMIEFPLWESGKINTNPTLGTCTIQIDMIVVTVKYSVRKAVNETELADLKKKASNLGLLSSAFISTLTETQLHFPRHPYPQIFL